MIFVISAIVLLFLGFVYEEVSKRLDSKRPIPGVMVDIDGCRHHVTTEGKNGPVIVLIHGAGDCSYSWIHIRKELAKFSRVISYDRASLGSSNPGPGPTPDYTVQELHNVLKKTGHSGPYILVGHSLGGIIARLYAQKYPHLLSGLVFLDSTHEFLKDDKKFKQGFAAIGVMLKIMRVLSPFGIIRILCNLTGKIPMFFDESVYYKQQLSSEEYKQWKGILFKNFAGKGAGAEFKESMNHIEVASKLKENSTLTPQFADLPLAIVHNPGYGAGWMEMQRELASRSSNSIFITSDRKGHSLQMPRPEMVVDAVLHVVNQVQLHDKPTLAKNI